MINSNKKCITTASLLLALVISVLILGCGKTPPSAYWTWSTEDSTAIQQILNQWHNTFKTAFGDTDSIQNITTLWDTIRGLNRDDMRTIWMRPHYWPRGIKRTITRHDMYDIFTPVKDTTVMVQLVESIFGKVNIYMDSCTVKIGDTTILGDTYALYTRYFVYAPDTVIEKDFQGISTRYLYFYRDTITNNWEFRKTSGGARIFVPDEGDCPTIFEGIVCSTAVKICTVMTRPDTLHYGMQGFYDLNSIFSVNITDTVLARFYKRLYIYEFDPITSFGFWHYNNKRRDLIVPRGTNRLTNLDTGWNNVLFEIVPWEALCKRGNYTAIIWSVLMKAE